MKEKLNITVFAVLFWITAPLITITGLSLVGDPLKVGFFLRDFVNRGDWGSVYWLYLVYLFVFVFFFAHWAHKNYFKTKPVYKIIGYAFLLAFYANVFLAVVIGLIFAAEAIGKRFELFFLAFNTPR